MHAVMHACMWCCVKGFRFCALFVSGRRGWIGAVQDQTLAPAARGGFIVNPACFFMMAQDLLASMRHSGVEITSQLPPAAAAAAASGLLSATGRVPSDTAGAGVPLESAGGSWNDHTTQPVAEGFLQGPLLASDHEQPGALSLATGVHGV